MATYDAELLVPPAPMDALKEAKEAEMQIAVVAAVSPRVSIDTRNSVIRRSIR
jgi:hypothetical protein